jgi:predicted dehydrogenase
MKTGLIGYGYWGKIINSKLKNNIINPSFNDIDWIFVATPPKTHYDIVKEYILKNKNIFCEKPLTLDYKSSKELIDLANERKIHLYIDNLFILRDEIKNLKLKPLNSIEFTWLKKGPCKDTLINDLLYHDLYLLIHLLGVSKIVNVHYIEKSNDILIFTFNYNNIEIKINYNRNWDKEKIKIINVLDKRENTKINIYKQILIYLYNYVPHPAAYYGSQAIFTCS